ncbi:hypothetical protein SEA_BUZZBUZZ_44 [Mycobacterium phage BuzzBuzz]|uniref:Uncharacterized protein n=8 Tax=Mycobacterium phage Bxz2 TaxID=205870 RepID=A0A0A7RV97_BPMB2|nr:hypothetical protein PBI_BXZ2_42 [Mycobacterium phage Bxz2]AJA41829.1 hypothetical protein PBI_SPIKE509_46 [Mycobacterium phage Spike509]AJA41920.1 hypothetical protein PBI_PHOXY_46 [Mycobacterium phage Phoxy]ANU79379.1 hypothetical protein SEA_BUZZBUZZ_44 [Mycobacterium phage BuzzBuzz]AOZ64817.1 hypothetical protein SEA_LOUIE6_45 [Mycobacterium phage Louie6]ASM62463.1 hypothetical protein SEA_KADY_46 [Mycobacterium phage KADY]QAY17480.1 hypothetical protein SEA_DAISHI_45 [Mycobacterium ph
MADDNPIIAVLSKRLVQLDKEIRQAQTGVDYHARKQQELQGEIDKKDREAQEILDHLVALKQGV